MKNISKKIIFLIVIFLVAFICLYTKEIYASSEEVEELKSVLNEYKEDLGDLNQLREIINTIYNDLKTAIKVDDALKEKLKADIDKISQIDGINPLIASVLDIELETQVENLIDENIYEMREEFLALKEWSEENAPKNENDTNNSNDKNEDINDKIDVNDKTDINDKKDNSITNNITLDKTTSNNKLPAAGIKNFIGILLLIVCICAIVFRIKNIQLKEIK